MKPTLLVVEDDHHIGQIITHYAQHKGFEPSWAEDGAKGLEMAIKLQPDVLIIDIMLPKLDGRDLLAQIKDQEWIKNSVVLFATARDEQNDRLVGLELGADDYIAKPLSLEHLFLKIEYLRKKKGQIVTPQE